MRRATAIVRSPLQTTRRTIARPKPRLPPVTMALSMAGQFARGADGERRHETNGGGDLVRRKRLAADLPDLSLHSCVVVGATRLREQDNVRGDERSRDWISSRPCLRHPHEWVPVDRAVDFFGIDLQSADVDDAA